MKSKYVCLACGAAQEIDPTFYRLEHWCAKCMLWTRHVHAAVVRRLTQQPEVLQKDT